MSEELIDIDAKPWVVHELEADVAMDGDRPRLVPVDGPRWRQALGKMAGRVKVSIQRARKKRSSICR